MKRVYFSILVMDESKNNLMRFQAPIKALDHKGCLGYRILRLQLLRFAVRSAKKASRKVEFLDHRNKSNSAGVHHTECIPHSE